MATFVFPTPTANYEGGLPATGREVRNDLDEVRNFIVGKNLEGDNIQDDTVALANLTPTVREFLAPTGAMMLYSVNSEPAGWLICDGQVVLRATYPDLYDLILDTYGPSTATTFTLPDFRARAAIGVNDAANPNGVNGSLSARAVTDEGGSETKTLTSDSQLPSHNHGIGNHTHPVNDHFHYLVGLQSSPATVTIGIVPETHIRSGRTSGGEGPEYDLDGNAPTPTGGRSGLTGGSTQGSSGTTDNKGASASFDVVNPFLAVNYIIKT